jgi:hypothetical protein
MAESPPAGPKRAKGGVSSRAFFIVFSTVAGVLGIALLSPYFTQNGPKAAATDQTSAQQGQKAGGPPVRQGADSAYRPEVPDPDQAIGQAKQRPPAPLAGGDSVGGAPGEQADNLRSYMAKQGAGGLAMAQQPTATDAGAPSATTVGANRSNGCGGGFIVGKVTGACEREKPSTPPVPVSSEDSLAGAGTVPGSGGGHGDRQQVHEATPEEIFERKVTEVRQEAFIKALNAPIAVILTTPGASSAAPTSAAAQIQALEQQRQALEAERVRAEQNARDAQQQLKQLQETGAGPIAFFRYPIGEFSVGGSGAPETLKG